MIVVSYCKICFQIWKHKKPIQFYSFCLEFDDWSSKKNGENYLRKCFWTNEEETGIKI